MVDKYIDLSPFVKTNNGCISWNSSVGVKTRFRYDNIWHDLEVLDAKSASNITILVDGSIEQSGVCSGKITNVNFGNIFRPRKYKYQIGCVINGLEIVAFETKIKATKSSYNGKIYNSKSNAYKVRCVRDGYEYVVDEQTIKKGYGCPVCAGRVVVADINSVGHLYPELASVFCNKEDAFKYTKNSTAVVSVKCPTCGNIRKIRVNNLVHAGKVPCQKCSDGISYPNKFAHELFNQLSEQCSEYSIEYSPSWANGLFYDNYLVLNDGTKLIVEMDGGQHYHPVGMFDCVNNDDKKDNLANEHGITVVRVNCDYGTNTPIRFDVIRNNCIDALCQYFDLSNINWAKCDKAATSSLIMKVAKYYEENTTATTQEIANKFGLYVQTVRNYLIIGTSLGLCKYKGRDSNRANNSKPIKMYDSDMKLVGVFKSSRDLRESFPELNMADTTLKKRAADGKLYRNHIFEFTTYENWLKFSVN